MDKDLNGDFKNKIKQGFLAERSMDIEKHRLFFENAPIGIIHYSKDGVVTDVNQSSIDIFASSREKLIGLNVNMLTNKTFASGVKKSLRGKDGYYEGEYTSLTGKRKCYIKAHWIPLIYKNKVSGGVGIIRDITERKANEKKMSELATVVKQAFQTIVITDLDGNITYVNPAFEKTTGYKLKEAIGQNPRILKTEKHDKDFYKELWNTIIAGNTWHGEFYNKKKDGSFYYEEAVIFPIKNEDGNIMCYAAVKQDITEKKKLQEQLHQVQKLEAIGTLAGGIAHDFNNVLSVIIGYAELTLDKVRGDDNLMSNMKRILQASDRAKNMVQQILTFSRKEKGEKTPLYMWKIMNETVKFLRASIPTTIDIKVDIVRSNTRVFGDSTQLSRVLMNLATNAIHALREKGGEIEIKLNDVEIEENQETINLKRGKYQLLTVKDNGCGMSKEVLNKIFEPYFTTKKVGEGTGMGLAVVHGIIKNHGGSIFVESEEGVGTKFKIYLPVTNEGFVSDNEDKYGLICGKGEKILYIDDEIELIELGKKILSKLEYNVFAYSNSLEALEAFKKSPYSFDLIITDMTMPKLTGLELAEKIRNINKDIPIILNTGYIDSINKHNLKDYGINAVITKPLNTRNIGEIIQNVLNKKGERTVVKSLT